MGHVAALEPSSAGRRDLELWDTWQRVASRLAPCPDLKLVCGDTYESGFMTLPSAPLLEQPAEVR
jgi:hypothetical protein